MFSTRLPVGGNGRYACVAGNGKSLTKQRVTLYRTPGEAHAAVQWYTEQGWDAEAIEIRGV